MSEAAPLASAFHPHHSSLVLNFSGARAGVDGIIGSRSATRRYEGWMAGVKKHNKPSFFFFFFFLLYIQSSSSAHVRIHTYYVPQSFCSASSSSETIFQTEGEKRGNERNNNENKRYTKKKVIRRQLASSLFF